MTDARVEANPNTDATGLKKENLTMSIGAKVVIMSGKRMGKASLIAKELAKLSESEQKRIWMKCQVPMCEARACLSLSSPYCYRHALLSSPDLLVGEIVRINTETDAIYDVIEKLTNQIDSLRNTKKARRKQK